MLSSSLQSVMESKGSNSKAKTKNKSGKSTYYAALRTKKEVRCKSLRETGNGEEKAKHQKQKSIKRQEQEEFNEMM